LGAVSCGVSVAALAIATRNWNARHRSARQQSGELGAITPSLWPGNYHNLETVIRFADQAGAPSLVRRKENLETGENSVTYRLEISVGERQK
jgi:hypothetical protein